MSERKSLVTQATEQMARLNERNEDAIRRLREAGDSTIYNQGFNPSSEEITQVLDGFARDAEQVKQTLAAIAALPPEPVEKPTIAEDGEPEAEWSY